MLFCPSQNIYILHEFKEGALFGSWSKSGYKIVPHTSLFNYNIMRPYQTTYYFALHKIFTSYTSLRKGPYLVPGPNQAKK